MARKGGGGKAAAAPRMTTRASGPTAGTSSGGITKTTAKNTGHGSNKQDQKTKDTNKGTLHGLRLFAPALAADTVWVRAVTP